MIPHLHASLALAIPLVMAIVFAAAADVCTRTKRKLARRRNRR